MELNSTKRMTKRMTRNCKRQELIKLRNENRAQVQFQPTKVIGPHDVLVNSNVNKIKFEAADVKPADKDFTIKQILTEEDANNLGIKEEIQLIPMETVEFSEMYKNTVEIEMEDTSIEKSTCQEIQALKTQNAEKDVKISALEERVEKLEEKIKSIEKFIESRLSCHTEKSCNNSEPTQEPTIEEHPPKSRVRAIGAPVKNVQSVDQEIKPAKLPAEKKSHHTNPTKDERSSSNFKCQICKKIFSRAFNLYRHNKFIHEKSGRIYKCDVCGKTFYQKDALSRHALIHQDRVKPFKCDKCGKKFLSKDGLQRHGASHDTNRRTKICNLKLTPDGSDKELCTRKFFSEYGLKQHQQKCHNIIK